jgi:2-phospho-L-lactate/phosphoenolpyruvate guanylyltransferase
VAAGLAELDLPGLGGLRRDVDTAAELRKAAEIGLGPRTRALRATVALDSGESP